MDVEGLLNLEDYVAPGVPPQQEKQIAKIPKKAPKYEMDPSYWELGDPHLHMKVNMKNKMKKKSL